MYRTYFQDLAKKENGKFFYNEETFAVGGGVRSPNVTYQVLFFYKGNKITILNRTGTSFAGFINCQLVNTIQPIPFEITTISHFRNLFLRRDSRFRIKAKNENIIYFLKKNSSLKILSEIADKENFTPWIVCEVNQSKSITAKYHLEFDNWTQVIDPIIELYKNLIDEFDKRIANIVSEVYRESLG